VEAAIIEEDRQPRVMDMATGIVTVVRPHKGMGRLRESTVGHPYRRAESTSPCRRVGRITDRPWGHTVEIQGISRGGMAISKGDTRTTKVEAEAEVDGDECFAYRLQSEHLYRYCIFIQHVRWPCVRVCRVL
jgi:hypothetical protein